MEGGEAERKADHVFQFAVACGLLDRCRYSENAVQHQHAPVELPDPAMSHGQGCSSHDAACEQAGDCMSPREGVRGDVPHVNVVGRLTVGLLSQKASQGRLVEVLDSNLRIAPDDAARRGDSSIELIVLSAHEKLVEAPDAVEDPSVEKPVRDGVRRALACAQSKAGVADAEGM